MEEYDVAIVGCGPAGMSAGIYAGRRGMKTLILERGVIGGQMASATKIDNYAGFDSIHGLELAKRMEAQVRRFGCEIRMEEVQAMDLRKGAITTNKGQYHAKAVILATGGGHKKLGIENEEKFVGRGVSYCITCDATFFKGKKVAFVGGSDAAITSALYLADYADLVYLIHRRDEFRAEEITKESVKKANITLVLDSVVKRIEGDKKVKAIVIENVKTKQTSTIEVDGLFIQIGIVPTTELAQAAGVRLDKLGYIETNVSKETNIEGVYAAGDATGGIWQIAQAVGDGSVAAVNAYKYIKSRE